MLNRAHVGAILLAAGRSSRFTNGNKLLVEFKGEPLVVQSARRLVALRLGRLVAVCDDAHGEVAKLLDAMAFTILTNPEPCKGLSSSLRIGVAHLQLTAMQAALVYLADMPNVEPAHLMDLIAAFDESSSPVVASSAEGVASPPALFARALFPRLLELQGDQGARAMLAGARLVEARRGTLRDIDRVTDLDI